MREGGCTDERFKRSLIIGFLRVGSNYQYQDYRK